MSSLQMINSSQGHKDKRSCGFSSAEGRTLFGERQAQLTFGFVSFPAKGNFLPRLMRIISCDKLWDVRAGTDPVKPGAWSLGPGAWGWCLGPGAWSWGPGAWSLELGAWGLGPGAWSWGPGAWGLGPGAWGLGLGSRAWGLGPGAWGLETGAWGLGPGAWGLGPGAWDLETGAWGLGPAPNLSRRHLPSAQSFLPSRISKLTSAPARVATLT